MPGKTKNPVTPEPAAEAAPITDGAGGDLAPATRTSAEIARLLGAPLEPGLYLVATPIGNLGDITLRALATLARADVVYCEDTRHSRTLLAHYAVTVRLEAYHEHNGARERPRILGRLASGQRVALISDAGTPLVSDPGYKLVREAIDAGYRVESLPGPSAMLAALTSSGLPSDTFLFAGFLPPRGGARRARIEELAKVPATLLFYEAPSRVADSLADLASVLGERHAVVARELTKRFETVRRGPLHTLATVLASEADQRGEFVLLVGPAETRNVTEAEIRAALQTAFATMSLRDAAKSVAADLDTPKSRVYDLAVAMREDQASDSGD